MKYIKYLKDEAFLALIGLFVMLIYIVLKK